MRRHHLHVYLFLLMAAPAWCGSCAPAGGEAGWQPPRVVRIAGVKEAYSLSPMYGVVFAGDVRAKDQPGEGPTWLLVRDGEAIAAEGIGPIIYRAADGNALTVTRAEGAMLLAGKVVALDLSADAGWQWLETAAPEGMAHLRFVLVKGSVTPERLALLEKLAAANPSVGLMCADEELAKVLPLLRPAWFSGNLAAVAAGGEALLARLDQVETLMVEAGKCEDLAPLAKLPALRRLVLTDWKEAEKRPLPDNLPALQALVVFGGDMGDLAPLGRQPGLEELSLVLTQELSDLGRLAEWPHLKTLSLQACGDVTDLAPLAHLKELRWLALPPKTTQEQLAQVAADHPGLIVLQAVGCEAITDLAPVKTLRNLEVLVLVVKAPLEPCPELKSLRLLAVHKPDEKATEQEVKEVGAAVAAFMEIHPDTAVVWVKPVCLGSGWILALGPAGALAWCLARRRRPVAQPDVRHA
ncbi:MAG TPA: hypothetical protein VM431_05830 [Phycisphaerae bacterium]|nr:hypothetical protein [Phycisphaerae bacterium]